MLNAFRAASDPSRPPASTIVVVKKGALSRAFVEFFKIADLFPRDGVGRQGAVLPLRLENDLAIAEYSKRKSKHQVWTYRRSRTAAAYLELVVSALQDVSADQRAFTNGLAPQEGEDAAAWRTRVAPLIVLLKHWAQGVAQPQP